MKIKLNTALLSLNEGEVGYCVLEDKIFKTNEVAKDILEFLENHDNSTEEEIRSYLFELYDVDQDTLENELKAFLGHLEKLDIISIS